MKPLSGRYNFVAISLLSCGKFSCFCQAYVMIAMSSRWIQKVLKASLCLHLYGEFSVPLWCTWCSLYASFNVVVMFSWHGFVFITRQAFCHDFCVERWKMLCFFSGYFSISHLHFLWSFSYSDDVPKLYKACLSFWEILKKLQWWIFILRKCMNSGFFRDVSWYVFRYVNTLSMLSI